MAEAILTELVKTIAEKVASPVWNKIVSASDIDSQIRGLQDLKNNIEATLLDAASASECSHSQQDVLEKLERGLAKLIDFQDKKASKAKQKEVMGGSKLSQGVGMFFSSSNQLITPFKDARKIKAITGELNLVATNHAQFGTILGSSSVNQNQTLRNESGSQMSTDIIVGRDGDRDKIVSFLLDNSYAAGIVNVASVVGMGGVGKTTLAQYVYKDERVGRCFDVQLWVSAAQDFDVKDVLRKIVASATDEKPLNYEMDQLQQRLFRAIAGKRFLLVLDSVWDQDSLRTKWLDLRSLLGVGAQGSKVIVTTRSDTVARIMGTQDPYMVGDLEDDDSWLLFSHVATTRWHDPGVEAIGKEIAKMCPKVPLVIRVIGSLLAGKHTVQEWRSFRDDQLKNFGSYGRDIVSTLKLSYDQLSVRLKLCVLYCSLFPKDFCFTKSVLIHLWIAMGYVEREYTTKRDLEDLAEEYVLCLINRGFFYVPEWDRKAFRMHSLMHDLMLSIAGVKYKMADSNTNEFDERICHLSFVSEPNMTWKALSSLSNIKQLKSFLLPHPSLEFNKVRHLSPGHDMPLFRAQSLRVLRMHGLGINKLPRSLGELILLRYLDVSSNPIRKLPDSVTQLVNLYLLDLSYCKYLEELPRDIGNLVMLRHLMLRGCDKLRYMPKGLLKLKGLKTLDYFVVGKTSNSLSLGGSKGDLACGLEDLNVFDNLKGWLAIKLVDRSKDIVSEAKGVNLDKKEKITSLTMTFRGSTIKDEMVLDNLKPGVNLEYMRIDDYSGQRLPYWMREGIHSYLPKLVVVHIYGCNGCKYLCSFGKLPHLIYLTLHSLDKVEYIENCSSSNSDNTVLLMNDHHSTPLFPSLCYLRLMNMPKLKGWSSPADIFQDQGQNRSQLLEWMPSFPKLEEVEIDMELVISLSKVFLHKISTLRHLDVSGKLDVKEGQTLQPLNVSAMQSQPVILLKNYLPMLLELCFYQPKMKLLPEEFRGMSALESLLITDSESFEAIPEWIDSLTSLKKITIYNCPNLKSLPHEISNLSNLTSLILTKCSKQLAERCEAPTGEDWPKIQHILNIRIKPFDDGESGL